MSVTIYTKDGCPYCAAARTHYREQGTSFDEISISKTPDAKAKILELTDGQAMVPVIIDNGEVKIGFGGG